MKRLFQIASWSGLILLALAGLVRLKLDLEVLNLLPEGQPGVRGLKLYQERFANARELIISCQGTNETINASVVEAIGHRLRDLTRLTSDVLWQPPWMEDGTLAAEISAYLWFNSDSATFSSLAQRLEPGRRSEVLAEAREALSTSLSPLDIARRAFDPYDLMLPPALTNFSSLSLADGDGMFGSPDGTYRLLFVTARDDLTGYADCARWLAQVRAEVEAARQSVPGSGEVSIRYTGRPAFVTEIAGSMQTDLQTAVAGTALIIAALFWFTHRRWLPMLWLLALLGLVLVATFGIGSLLLGPIHVVSLGFAAVLLGLAVDYAVVHYQEALAHPSLSVPEIRRAIAPSILWAAITTVAAFLMLNFGGLPGLAQLGSLVGLGVTLAALVMVAVFLPPLFPARRAPPASFPPAAWLAFLTPPKPPETIPTTGVSRFVPWTTALLTAVAVLFILAKPPGLDRSGDALRFQDTEAEAALREMTSRLGLPPDPFWLIAEAPDPREMHHKLMAAGTRLSAAKDRGLISGFLLPTALWPQTDHQETNRETARALVRMGQDLRAAAVGFGFRPDALQLTEAMLKTWDRLASNPSPAWPTNRMSTWLLNRFVAPHHSGWLALGLVYPAPDGPVSPELLDLAADFEEHGLSLSGWPLLGAATLRTVRERWIWMVIPMAGLVLLSLWLAFRRLQEVALSLATLILSGLLLLAAMGWFEWDWNLLNLMAVPLILGTGVDYGIFMQLGLRRHGGNVRLVRRSIGRALFLCGGTAIAGFGGLAWSGNQGMASLGKVCALGIGLNMIIAILLLPGWWAWVFRQPSTPSLRQPSRLYGARLWQAAVWLAARVPERLLRRVVGWSAGGYGMIHRERRSIVAENLGPVLGESAATQAASLRLFRLFGEKLVDLWRFEAGCPPRVGMATPHALERLRELQAQRRGILLVTPHLGNWEIGAPLLLQHGFNLLVVTQDEPGAGFTELRRASRARWGIETLVIGADAFAFLEVIRRLQDGALIALLIDRPHRASAVAVELFGRSFEASIAPAELARASGCAVFGVTIITTPEGAVARMLPEFTYVRQELGSRAGRIEFTQRILRAFEPEIRHHADQWFHFVRIWPETSTRRENSPP